MNTCDKVMASCEKNNEIKQNIVSILHARFGLTKEQLLLNSAGHFWGVNGWLNARDMVYLVWILESEYNISFTKEDFDNPSLFVLDGLSQIIKQKITSA